MRGFTLGTEDDRGTVILGGAIFSIARSSASSVSAAPISRAVSMNRSNCGFSSGFGLRTGISDCSISCSARVGFYKGFCCRFDRIKRMVVAIVINPSKYCIEVCTKQRVQWRPLRIWFGKISYTRSEPGAGKKAHYPLFIAPRFPRWTLLPRYCPGSARVVSHAGEGKRKAFNVLGSRTHWRCGEGNRYQKEGYADANLH